MVARGVGRELAASVAAHRDILYRIQHPCGMIIPCFSPVVNTFFCGFGGSRNFRDIVTKTTGYSGVVWLKGRPGRHGGKGRTTRPAGGLPGWLPADLAAAVPSGGRAFFVACQPCLWFAFLPPSSRPPSRREGGDFLFSYARGFAPCIPGAEPGRHRSRGTYHAPGGGLPGWLPADLAVPESAGVACLLCCPPTLPLVCFPAPILPPPFPAGRGRFFVFLCKGLRPLHPRG